MAQVAGPQGPAQHLAATAASAFARAQSPGKHLAVHAPELAVKPHLQILRRYRRPLLLCLEYADRPTLENHVHCSARVGNRASVAVRIGISSLLLLLLFVLVTLSNVILITVMRYAIERKRDEQALQASKDRLQFALDAALLGWWQYDPHRRVISVDTRFREIFDVATDEMPVEEIKKLVHPDDAERLWADHQAS